MFERAVGGGLGAGVRKLWRVRIRIRIGDMWFCVLGF